MYPYIHTIYNRPLTQTGAPPLLEELAHIPHLSPADFKQLVDSGTTTILDTRPVRHHLMYTIHNYTYIHYTATSKPFTGPHKLYTYNKSSLLCFLGCTLPKSLFPSFFSQQVDFNSGHIPGSINFSLGVAEGAGTIVGVEDGNFAIWVRQKA